MTSASSSFMGVSQCGPQASSQAARIPDSTSGVNCSTGGQGEHSSSVMVGLLNMMYMRRSGLRSGLPCTSIVNAADMLVNTGLLDGISVAETYAVGDCANPYNIALAIRGGNDAGRAV